jgi:hypothetical protein
VKFKQLHVAILRPFHYFEARVVNPSADGEVLGSDLLVGRLITEADDAVQAARLVIVNRFEVDNLKIDIRVPKPSRRARPQRNRRKTA